MSKLNYEQCTIADHDDEFLNLVCVDQACEKHRLLCVHCVEEHHPKCRNHTIRKFLLEFRQQLANQGSEPVGPNLEELLPYYESVKTTLEQTQKLINDIFEKTKTTVLDAKKMIQQMSNQNNVKQLQAQKLQDFEQTKNQENFANLLSEIESYKPNADRFSFTVKKPQTQQLDKLSERIAHAKQHAQQYQSAMNTFTEQFLNQQEALKKSLQNYFLTAPQRITEQELNPENGRFDKFKSNQLYTPIQPLQIERQEKSIIAIDDDLEEVVKNKQNDTLNSSKKLNSTNGSASKQQIVQLSISDILENQPEDKPIIKQPPPPPPKQNAQPLPPQKQIPPPRISAPPAAPFNSTRPPPPPPQPQSPLKGATQDENQVEVETVLNVSQDAEFQMLPNGKDIHKIIFLNSDTIAGTGGNLLQVFQASTGQRIFFTSTETEITDIAYYERDDLNGTLYIATKRGKLETFTRESAEYFKASTQLQVDKPGNLLLQVNQQNLLTLGEERMVKIWSVQNLREQKRMEISEVATALHTDQKLVFIGGNKFLLIWDSQSNQKKSLQSIDSRVVGIQTQDQKLVVALQDSIKIFEKTNSDYSQIYESKFGWISSMQILKKWPIVLVSCTQDKQQKVCLYNYEQDSSEKLCDQLATYCAVREFDKVYNVAFGKEKGGCVTYRIEQNVPQP